MSDLYNKIMSLCASMGVSGYRLCKDTGMQPSVLTDLKMGRQAGLSAKNADRIASYLGVSVGCLLGTEQEKAPALTKKDERDIEKRLESVLEDLEGGQDGLMFSGEPLDQETKELIVASLRNSMKMGKIIAKQKFTPKKYRREGE